MKQRAPSLLLVAMLIAACSDISAPGESPPGVGVPVDLRVPLHLQPPGSARVPDGRTAPDTGPEDEAATAGLFTAYTEIAFGPNGVEGSAEMTYYATTAKQVLTLSVSKDGSTLGSKEFTSEDSWLFPAVSTLYVTGQIPAPSCGAAATGSTLHSASLVWKGFTSGLKRTSLAGPQYQVACPPPQTVGGGGFDDGENGGERGTLLIICLTTEYYSADGDFLYDETVCRQELWME